MQIVRRLQRSQQRNSAATSRAETRTIDDEPEHVDEVRMLREDVNDINLRVRYLEHKLRIPTAER